LANSATDFEPPLLLLEMEVILPEITIKIAETEADFDAARDLCQEWLDWHWRAFPDDGPRVGNPMDVDTFQSVIAELPQIHARPKGAILLAYVNGKPAGCVMYHEHEAEVAEIKRLFVSENGRGQGLGRLLLLGMFDAIIADGYQTVLFSSARFLTHARGLYESVGFHDIPHPDGFPDDLRDFVYFMERPLA
jgi:GNAT superfamily N-acetyltransferase